MRASSDRRPPPDSCRRCGTCCQKGGPAFHGQDRRLIDTGAIEARFLFTIRRGEPSFDNIRGTLVPAETDIIKIRGRRNSWCCTFFNDRDNGCDIYADRPMECRLLKCWDPSAITSAYRANRLTRADLLREVTGLWELVDAHQVRCDYAAILPDMKKLPTPEESAARRRITEALLYDREIRRLAQEQAGVAPDLCDFLFGRPLSDTLSGLGLDVRETEGRITLVCNAHHRRYLDGL